MAAGHASRYKTGLRSEHNRTGTEARRRMEINKVRREKRRLEKVVSRLTELGPHAYACTPEHIDGKDWLISPFEPYTMSVRVACAFCMLARRARCSRVAHAPRARRRACCECVPAASSQTSPFPEVQHCTRTTSNSRAIARGRSCGNTTCPPAPM